MSLHNESSESLWLIHSVSFSPLFLTPHCTSHAWTSSGFSAGVSMQNLQCHKMDDLETFWSPFCMSYFWSFCLFGQFCCFPSLFFHFVSVRHLSVSFYASIIILSLVCHFIVIWSFITVLCLFVDILWFSLVVLCLFIVIMYLFVVLCVPVVIMCLFQWHSAAKTGLCRTEETELSVPDSPVP